MGVDLQRLSDSLVRDVLPFDPQARHGRDIALDWFRAQRLEPPANDQCVVGDEIDPLRSVITNRYYLT